MQNLISVWKLKSNFKKLLYIRDTRMLWYAVSVWSFTLQFFALLLIVFALEITTGVLGYIYKDKVHFFDV